MAVLNGIGVVTLSYQWLPSNPIEDSNRRVTAPLIYDTDNCGKSFHIDALRSEEYRAYGMFLMSFCHSSWMAAERRMFETCPPVVRQEQEVLRIVRPIRE